MDRENKKCVMCNKHYKYCENCPSKYDSTKTWLNIFCSENCRDLYNIYDQIKANAIDNIEANEKMKKLDTSYINKINNPMGAVLSVALNNKESSIEITEAPKKVGRRKKQSGK